MNVERDGVGVVQVTISCYNAVSSSVQSRQSHPPSQQLLQSQDIYGELVQLISNRESLSLISCCE